MENVYTALTYSTRSVAKSDYQTVEIMEPKEMAIFLRNLMMEERNGISQMGN